MFMRTKTLSTLTTAAFVALVVVLMGTSQSQAAVVFTGNVNGTTAPTLDNSFGTLELAYNLGNGGALLRDGINFANINANRADCWRFRSAFFFCLFWLL